MQAYRELQDAAVRNWMGRNLGTLSRPRWLYQDAAERITPRNTKRAGETLR